MNTNELQMQTIATSIYEDFVTWVNLNKFLRDVKKHSKAGIVSIQLALRSIESKIYNQLKSLSNKSLEKLQHNFTEHQWIRLSIIFEKHNSEEITLN